MACPDHHWEDHPVKDSGTPWENATHGWAATVDGISVVAALSEWLIHTNRRAGGSWTQRYEQGVPTSDLTPVADDGTTGTTVHFQPDIAILVSPVMMAPQLTRAANWPQLRVELVDERPS